MSAEAAQLLPPPSEGIVDISEDSTDEPPKKKTKVSDV